MKVRNKVREVTSVGEGTRERTKAGVIKKEEERGMQIKE